MTDILWIDGGESDFIHAINNIFPKLWDKSIRSLVTVLDSTTDHNKSIYDAYVLWLCGNNKIFESSPKMPLISKNGEYSDCCKQGSPTNIPDDIRTIILNVLVHPSDVYTLIDGNDVDIASIKLYDTLKDKYNVILWTSHGLPGYIIEKWNKQFLKSHAIGELPPIYNYRGCCANHPNLWEVIK